MEASIHETGETDYAVATVIGSVIVGTILDVIAVKPQLSDVDLAEEVFDNSQFKAQMKSVKYGEAASLFRFMHSPAQKYCDCMKYVVTAAELGMTCIALPMKVSGSITQHCNMCGKSIAAPKLCSLCKKVVYCGEACQREAWPQHKKECKGHLAKKRNKSAK